MTTFIEYFNSQFSALQDIDFFARILLACLCGACIGFERSKRLKEAGIRTHIIVCCAASLLMIVSKYGFADLTDAAGIVFNGTRGADPARIAAQVVSGISFLGAGVIFKNGNTIKGLTTAAGIWATAGIGLAIGSGMLVVGIFSTVVIAVLQIIMHRFTVGGDMTQTSRSFPTLWNPRKSRALRVLQCCKNHLAHKNPPHVPFCGHAADFAQEKVNLGNCRTVSVKKRCK